MKMIVFTVVLAMFTYKNILFASTVEEIISKKEGKVFYDEQTDLTWMKCSLGQVWTGVRCTGEPKKYEWQEAINEAKQFIYAGYADWRLPTRMELHSLVNCSTGRRPIELDADGETLKVNGEWMDGGCLGYKYISPTINSNVFLDTPAEFYWSSTLVSDDSVYAWGIDFGFGQDYYGFRFAHYNVRFVRSGQLLKASSSEALKKIKIQNSK